MAYGLSSVMGACKPPCDAAVSERHAAGRRAMYRCQSEGAGQGWVAPSTGGAPELISGRTNHRSLDVVVRHNPGWKGGGEERTREEDGTWIVGGRKAIITGLSVSRPPAVASRICTYHESSVTSAKLAKDSGRTCRADNSADSTCSEPTAPRGTPRSCGRCLESPP